MTLNNRKYRIVEQHNKYHIEYLKKFLWWSYYTPLRYTVSFSEEEILYFRYCSKIWLI